MKCPRCGLTNPFFTCQDGSRECWLASHDCKGEPVED